MEKFNVQPGTKVAPDRFHITVMEEGPYLVYGQPPLKQQFMLPNREGEIWYYKAGKEYATQDEPTALCRCGASKTKPYCDGSHVHTDWGPSLTASEEPLLDEAESFGGPEVALTDNREYCAFARFCDAKGQVWNLVEEEGERARDLTIREAGPLSGRTSFGVARRQPSARTAFRTFARPVGRSAARVQRRVVGARRHSDSTRRRVCLRDPQPGDIVPLRPVVQQAVLRRDARFDGVSRRIAGKARAGRRRVVGYFESFVAVFENNVCRRKFFPPFFYACRNHSENPRKMVILSNSPIL